MIITICRRYVGVACVNGTCPIANQDIYNEYGIPVVWSCEDCQYRRGCKDCCFENTDACPKTATK